MASAKKCEFSQTIILSLRSTEGDFQSAFSGVRKLDLLVPTNTQSTYLGDIVLKKLRVLKLVTLHKIAAQVLSIMEDSSLANRTTPNHTRFGQSLHFAVRFTVRLSTVAVYSSCAV